MSYIETKYCTYTYFWVAIVLIGFFSVLLLSAPPAGEFPIMDDWAYAQSARHLLETGQLKITEWASAAIIIPVTFGAFVAKLMGGFSFTSLRYSTLFFSFVSCIALFDLLWQLKISRSAALLGSLTLIVNPIFVFISYSFMSDISYFSLMVVSLSLYIRGIKHSSVSFLLIGSIVASISYLSRQLGIALPMGVVIFLILRDRRLDWKLIAIASAFPIATVTAHTLWLRYLHGVPWAFSVFAIGRSIQVLLEEGFILTLAKRIVNALLYIGIFTLPVSLAQITSSKRDKLIIYAPLFSAWLVVLVIYCLINLFAFDRIMPYLFSTINAGGIGPQDLLGERLPLTPKWVFILVTIASPFAGAVQGAVWTNVLIHPLRESIHPGTILVLSSVIIAGVTVLNSKLWDEYLIVFIPASLYLLLRIGPIKAGGWLIGLLTAFFMLLYTILEMDEYMAWNTARWQAGENMTAQGIKPESIKGGFGWTGWHEFETALPKAIATGQGDSPFAWNKMTPELFRISFEPLKGYKVVDRVMYRTRLLNRQSFIYVLRTPIIDIPNEETVFDIGSSKEGRLLLEGFSKKERKNNDSFRWAIGKEGKLIFDGLRMSKPTKINFIFEVSPFLIHQHKEITLTTGLSSRTINLLPGMNTYSVKMAFPAGDNMVIYIKYSDAASPKSLGLGTDPRVISVRWKKVAIRPVEKTPETNKK